MTSMNLDNDEYFTVGCSACGTKAIDSINPGLNLSPPKLRSSSRILTPNLQDPNSGSFTIIHKRFASPSRGNGSPQRKLKKTKIITESSPPVYGQIAYYN